ncbi:MAG: hypothetical protein EOP45_00815 [Sphingobacteriaceae bacterium]|nr:MAG: hypothetical protein EOP45_00815 [Sphingobacteriaceae bacterium]
MTHSTFNNRRIIWESKAKQITVTVVSFLFVVIAIWTKDKHSFFMVWAPIVFFGGGGLFMLVRLLNPKNLFVTHNTKLGKQILAEQSKKQQEDLGFFTYDDRGFSIKEHASLTHYNWTDIKTVFGYKVEHFTDEICLDIFTNENYCIKLTEDTPGWYQFNKRLNLHIPTITKNWEEKIAVPAFETKITLLFDKNGRTKEQAEVECYKE